jgi:hypothetical protein
MTRPATARIKLNPQLGRMPILQFCRPAELRIDPAYQRDIANGQSQTLIRKIAQHWNWDLCQPLVVARRIDMTERLFVIDGQHRLEAARLRGDIDQLPCVIVNYDNAADEAASFVHLNQQRRPLTKIDLFKAAVASEDPESTAIVSAMHAAGLSIAPHTNHTAWKPGMIANIGPVEKVWRQHGPVIAARAMEAMAQGFAGQVLQYAGTIWPGVVAVCAAEMRGGKPFAADRFERFVNMLSLRKQQFWRDETMRIRGEDPELRYSAASARAFLTAWDKANGNKPASPVAAPPPAPRPPLPIARNPAPAPARAPVGLDALKPRWCDQCDQNVSAQQVAACRDRFCKAKAVA